MLQGTNIKKHLPHLVSELEHDKFGFPYTPFFYFFFNTRKGSHDKVFLRNKKRELKLSFFAPMLLIYSSIYIETF